VLTPHPGEAGALLREKPAELNRDRVLSARRLAQETGCVVLLKGAASVVAEPGGDAVVIPTGGPALGTGGTGDVLLGMLSGLLAQGQEPAEAAALAAFWHGFAADRIAPSGSGLLARELPGALPAAAQALRVIAAARDAAPLGAGLAVAFPEP
jgi:NAD(P)H-hydrate epimerase